MRIATLPFYQTQTRIRWRLLLGLTNMQRIGFHSGNKRLSCEQRFRYQK